jgi:hypothetical protein
MVTILMSLFAVVRAVVEIGDAGVLMQTQDTSASRNMDVASLQVDSQFTKMEESLHATLLGVLKDPETMKRLPVGWLDSIVSQMKVMREAIEAENAQDQDEINNASRAVA